MDEAGSRARIQATMRPPDVKSIEAEIEEIKGRKEAAIKAQDFEKAAALRDSEKEAKDKLENILTEWRERRDEQEVLVTDDDIRHVVSKWTGVPLSRMEQADMDRLLGLRRTQGQGHRPGRSRLRHGQGAAPLARRPQGPEAPHRLVHFPRPDRRGQDPPRKTLAQYMFGDETALIQIDMSEYMDAHNVSRLVGAPPGYVGYEEGGQLSEKVRRRPYSVVLFDEIEKAHPDIWNLLLQILEDGVVTDPRPQGRFPQHDHHHDLQRRGAKRGRGFQSHGGRGSVLHRGRNEPESPHAAPGARRGPPARLPWRRTRAGAGLPGSRFRDEGSAFRGADRGDPRVCDRIGMERGRGPPPPGLRQRVQEGPVRGRRGLVPPLSLGGPLLGAGEPVHRRVD
jgi:hypothetical protein